MREIKFRAWHSEGKEMVYFEPKDLIRDEYQCQALSQLMLENSKFLMQFTGLKDENGIEIYDGDILSKTYISISTDKTKTVLRSVIWDKRNARFLLLSGDHIYFEVDGQAVVGNIYENPDFKVFI